MTEQHAEAPPKAKRVRAPRPKKPSPFHLTPETRARFEAENAERAKPADPLDAFVELATSQPANAVAALFWHHRHQNPGFSIEVKASDLKAFTDCTEYLKVRPKIQVVRPQGLPAQAQIPAQGNRRAVPGRVAQPPKDYVVIQMVDQDGNGFVPIENNEEDLAKQQKAAVAKRTKERALIIAGNLQGDVQAGNYSTATMLEAVEALQALARA